MCWKAFRLLLGKKFYAPSAVLTSLAIFSIFAVSQQILFLQPFGFYVTQGNAAVFALILSFSVLAGLTFPMAVYRALSYRFDFRSLRSILPIVAISAGCGCTFAVGIIAVTGTVGSAAIGFLGAFQNEIIISATAVLAYSLFSDMRFLGKLHCR